MLHWAPELWWETSEPKNCPALVVPSICFTPVLWGGGKGLLATRVSSKPPSPAGKGQKHKVKFTSRLQFKLLLLARSWRNWELSQNKATSNTKESVCYWLNIPAPKRNFLNYPSEPRSHCWGWGGKATCSHLQLQRMVHARPAREYGPLTGGLLSLLTGMGGAERSRKAGVTFPGQADLRKITSGHKLLYHIVGKPIYLQELRCK